MHTFVDHHRQFVDNTLTNRKLLKFTQDGRDVIKLSGLCCDTSCDVLYSFFGKSSFIPYSKL